MGHLSADVLLDVAEGARAESAVAHLAACDVCRRQVEELRATIALTEAVLVPEPSPLFWQHLSARVSTAVESEASRQPAWSFTRIGWFGGALASAAAVVIAVVLVTRMPSAPIAPADGLSAGPQVAVSDATMIDLPDASDDPSLSLLVDLASDLDWEAATAGFASRPNVSEHALASLDDDERIELGRLLREELGGPGV